MNSRERVLAALNHQEPDRVPIAFPAIARRASRPSPTPSCATLWACRSGRSASTIRSSSWPSSTTTCSIGSASTRSSWAAASRWKTSSGPTGRCPTGRRARCPPGRCPSASPDAGCCARTAAASSRRCPTARSTSSRPTGPSWIRRRISTISRARSTRACGRPSPARRGRSPPGRTATASWPKARSGCGEHRSGHHRAVRRQPAGDRPVPLPQRQLLHAPGRRAGQSRRVPRPAGRASPGQPGALPGPRRPVHRHHPLRRRPGHADRAADLAAHVPRVLQAAARAACGSGRRSWRTSR